MKIYISIPISGHDETAQREKADMMKARLSRLGHAAVNPFDIYAGENPTYIDFIVADLRQLWTCDAIMLCKDWQKSRGCRLERSFAEIYGLKLMFETVEFPAAHGHDQ